MNPKEWIIFDNAHNAYYHEKIAKNGVNEHAEQLT